MLLGFDFDPDALVTIFVVLFGSGLVGFLPTAPPLLLIAIDFHLPFQKHYVALSQKFIVFVEVDLTGFRPIEATIAFQRSEVKAWVGAVPELVAIHFRIHFTFKSFKEVWAVVTTLPARY